MRQKLQEFDESEASSNSSNTAIAAVHELCLALPWRTVAGGGQNYV